MCGKVLTHLFLSVDEINNIKQYVPQAIKDVSILVIAENKNGNPVGFMGVDDKRLEMLFVLDKYRGQGIGKQLLQYGIENYSINELTVNEAICILRMWIATEFEGGRHAERVKIIEEIENENMK